MGFCDLQHKEGEPINRWLQMFSVFNPQCILFIHKHIRQYGLTASRVPGAMLRAGVGLSEFGFPGHISR